LNARLDTIITDSNLVWDKSFESLTNKFSVKLSDDTIKELLDNKNNLEQENPTLFPILKNEILKIKTILLNKHGFIIIDGKSFEGFSKKEVKSIYIIISNFLGILIPQNIKKEILVEVKDEGKSMKTGGRYHQTRDGGSCHTDSPQWKNTPDFIGLCCIYPAKIGGVNKYISAYTIHNLFIKQNISLLEILYDNFYFDKRGEFKSGEDPTIFEPIIRYEDKKLTFRYLRTYIDQGYKVENKELSDNQLKSLELLDKFLENPKNIVEHALQKYDMTFFNNNWVIHGRTSFEDHEDLEKKRLMLRVWIKNTV
jgi:alpha-ketoglutarate-dependent taurine dioxygenase